MTDKITQSIYRISIPLPVKVLGSVNAYIISDKDRNLVVDPGMEHPLCFEALKSAIDELNIDLRRTDFFITHHHPDHLSLVFRFLTEGSRIYINKLEARLAERSLRGSCN